MNEDFSNIGAASAVASTDTIYTVQAGDSLSKIAQTFYGDAKRYPEIAARNAIAGDSIVYIGQRLIIPAAQRTQESTAPSSPGGSVPVAYGNEIIETVTTSARRSRVWEDWRFWAAAGGAVALIWFMNRGSRRS